MKHYFETENKLSLHAFINEDKVVILKCHDYGNILLNIPIDNFLETISKYFYEVKDGMIILENYLEDGGDITRCVTESVSLETFVHYRFQKYDIENVIALCVREYFKLNERQYFL